MSQRIPSRVIRLVSVALELLMVGSAATAQEAKASTVWICSVIREGKPQTIKYTMSNGKIVPDDWVDRLYRRYSAPTPSAANDGTSEYKVIEDTDHGLVGVGRGAGGADYYARILIINKTTGDMTDTVVSTLHPPAESKGACTQ